MLKTAIFLGTIGVGAYLYYGDNDIPSINLATKTNAAQTCEILAAHPEDPTKSVGITGVSDQMLDGAMAFDACRAAYEADNTDIKSAWHLGRVMLAMGAFDEGWPYVEYAATNGYAPAIHLFARVLEDNEAAPMEQLLQLYKDAAEVGFVPAERDVARLTDLSLEFGRFSQPSLMENLVNGDTTEVLAFRINVPHEALGLRSGLVRYVAGFADTFSGPFFCPGALPAGLPEQISHHAKWTALEEAIHVVQSPDIIKQWLTDASRDPKRFAIELIEADMRLDVARKAGERDAALVAQEGCTNQAVGQIGTTLQAVADHLGRH